MSMIWISGNKIQFLSLKTIFMEDCNKMAVHHHGLKKSQGKLLNGTAQCASATELDIQRPLSKY